MSQTTNSIPSLNEPPPSEIMPFEAFASLMTETNLDDFYKYYDSDGTVDLEDTYDGSSDSSSVASDDSEVHNDGNHDDEFRQKDDGEDDDNDEEEDEEEEKYPNAEIREAEILDRAATSRHNDQALQDAVFNTQVVLERLSIAAQPILEEQPMSTRIVLANQAVGVFERYGGHGSMYRFSEDVRRFLDGGERVRRAGVDGRDPKKDAILRFAPVNPMRTVDEGEKKAGKRKDGRKSQGESVRKGRKVDSGSSICAGVVKTGMIEMGRAVADGAEKGDAKRDGYRVIKPKPIFPHVHTGLPYLQVPSVMVNGRPVLSPTSPSSALARFNLHSPVLPIYPQPTNRHAYSCTTHPTQNSHLATQPYDPISMTFSWPATSRQNAHPTMPTPGLLDALNTVLLLHNAEGRFLLSYYVRKFDTPIEFGGTGSGPSTPREGVVQQKVEPPHALFRLGISQYMWGKVGNIIDNREVDELGLTPEARRLLGEVWVRHPSTAVLWQDSLPSRSPASNTYPNIGSTVSANNNNNDDLLAHESDFDPYASDYENSNPEDTPAVRDKKLRRRVARAERQQTRNKIDANNRQVARGGLNPWEKVVLARAANTSVHTIDTYWDLLREKTKAWGAMKMWCAAMEKRIIKKAKVEGRW